jgi:uncharacterized membrane protein YfcA
VLIPLEGYKLVAAAGALALGALVQGSVGFGMALVAAPLLTLIDPILVPGPVIAVGLISSGLVAVRDREAMDLSALKSAVPGLLIGSLTAATMLSYIAVDHIGVTLGGLVLVAVLLSVLGLHVAPTPRNLFYASTLAGFMDTTASIPGPPLALIYQRAAGPRLRATLAPLFISSGVISLATLSAFDRFGRVELTLALLLIPGVLTGLALSAYTSRRIDSGSVRHAVLLVAAAAGVAAILRDLP